MKRKHKITHEPARHTYKVCPVCQKRKVEEVGLAAGDGQRWYCSEKCLDRGERVHRGNER